MLVQLEYTARILGAIVDRILDLEAENERYGQDIAILSSCLDWIEDYAHDDS
jgi:hypothetical protein